MDCAKGEFVDAPGCGADRASYAWAAAWTVFEVVAGVCLLSWQGVTWSTCLDEVRLRIMERCHVRLGLWRAPMVWLSATVSLLAFGFSNGFATHFALSVTPAVVWKCLLEELIFRAVLLPRPESPKAAEENSEADDPPRQ